MQTTTTNQTETDALLSAAANVDRARRIKAVHEFPGYRLLQGGDLLNLKTGLVYGVVGKSGCTCPDYAKVVGPLRARMTAAGVAANLCCKHQYARMILGGRGVRVDNLVFRAGKK